MSTDSATELVSGQDLYIRLLYSRKCREEFARAPDDMIARWRLSPRWRRLLPDLQSEGFQAELHGRRIQAAQELLTCYRATLEHLTNGQPAAPRIAGADWFSEYLGSDAFLDARHSLPHPSGAGRGYEGWTRFFFWAREHFDLTSPGADLRLRNDLYTDFAALADTIAYESDDPYFVRLRRGFYWRAPPGQDRVAYALTPDRSIVTVTGRDVVRSLASLDLINLDDLVP